ncbi:MAG TPA: cyanophycin synthetase, partial [Pirellulaceae bacterium]|nr:cyanophycin synthetase [Pirellulaceae bacterium]
DYGHNTSALAAILDAFESFPETRRRALYSAAGDRRDCDMIELGRMLGDHFDSVILYEDRYVRGRAEGEIMRLMRQGVAEGKRASEVEEVRGAIAAVERALATVQPGELLLLQADEIDVTVDFLKGYLAAHPEVQQVKLPDAAAPAPIEVVGTLEVTVVEMLAESPPALHTEPALAVQDCGG